MVRISRHVSLLSMQHLHCRLYTQYLFAIYYGKRNPYLRLVSKPTLHCKTSQWDPIFCRSQYTSIEYRSIGQHHDPIGKLQQTITRSQYLQNVRFRRDGREGGGRIR